MSVLRWIAVALAGIAIGARLSDGGASAHRVDGGLVLRAGPRGSVGS